MTHPKAGEWWCPGRYQGTTEEGNRYAGCDGDPKCDICRGQSLQAVLEGRVSIQSWFELPGNMWKHSMLRGWANLMASRYGRPVYLVGSALTQAKPRDIDVRVVLSATEYENRFGSWKQWSYGQTSLEYMDEQRRWHQEIAKMNVQAAATTHLPVDFQIQPLPDAMRYSDQRRQLIDDLPDLIPPWED